MSKRFLPAPVKQAFWAAIAAGAVFLAYPTLIAQQDVAEFSTLPLSERWLAHFPEKPGASIFVAGAGLAHRVNGQAGTDPFVTAAIATNQASAKMELTTNIGKTVLPQRVRRDGMGSRVVSQTVARPPAHFSAGSVLERQSWAEPLNVDKRTVLAFVRPLPPEEAYQVAAVFHENAPKEEPLHENLPVVLANLVYESAANVLAYQATEETLPSPFAFLLDEVHPINLIPRLDKSDHDWADDPLPASVLSEQEQHCLTAGIYFEARGEPVRGQAAVAQVILNRVRNPAYPDSICAVVYQNKTWRNRCQFSFACDKVKDKISDPKRWSLAADVAREVTEGRIWLADVGSSTHYHANYVTPGWAGAMKKAGQIGLHIFYKTFGGGWS